ncbi:MAG: sialate O-acetylesterase, partial [Phycisphaeraceae bacterium]|nr:sialate O-acetylesterase [Phycisphaeraceae bacterium]
SLVAGMSVAVGLSIGLAGCDQSNQPAAASSQTPAAASARYAPDVEGLELAAPFADNAVLQQEMDVPVWGWAKPGTTVTVSFAGQTKEATAGDDAKWRVDLDPLTASFKPAEMVVKTSDGETKTISNLLVGEVWMISGQSNMQWKVNKSAAKNLSVEPRDGVNPIREFEVTSVYAVLHPITRAEGNWKDGEYDDYSAIGFSFAHKLYNELDVPIGILNCSFSTTQIQAWIPREGFEGSDDPYTRAIAEKLEKTDPASEAFEPAWEAFYESIEQTLAENEKRVEAGEEPLEIPTDPPGNFHGNRDATWLYNGRMAPVVPYAIRGALWNQGYASQHEGLKYYQNLHSLVRGWRRVWNRPELPVYFHQFFTARRHRDKLDNTPTIGSTAEMRYGALLARDIPNADMASQIDIGGGIHYAHKVIPARRMARHALKNQYGRDVVTTGPIFESYEVKDGKVVVHFDHADGGLVVASPPVSGKEIAEPKIIDDNGSKVELFYVADENRVWYPAKVRIEGDKAMVWSPEVEDPRGVTYATRGTTYQPALYNQAKLPASPFIVYDHEPVISETWPDPKLKIANQKIDPDSVGLSYKYRKMPILSTQFRDDAILQADRPVKIWGSVLHPHEHFSGDHWDKKNPQIHFSFDGIEKTIPVTKEMDEWSVTVPAREAGHEPGPLNVRYTIDGELVHERTIEGIIYGDVWYVAAPGIDLSVPEVVPSGQTVRMMAREAKRWRNDIPWRFSVAVSTNPTSRFRSHWKKPEGLAAALGHRLAARTGRPTGIIFMQTQGANGNKEPDQTRLKHWMPVAGLKNAPSLKDDFADLAALVPGTKYYAENARNYIASWRAYWDQYIAEMRATGKVPDAVQWGWYPTFRADIESDATEVYNVTVHSFTPAALKGIIFLAGPAMVEDDQGAYFGEQMSALANAWKLKFTGNPTFIYTLPSSTLAEKITRPEDIVPPSEAVPIDDWSKTEPVIEAAVKAAAE